MSAEKRHGQTKLVSAVSASAGRELGNVKCRYPLYSFVKKKIIISKLYQTRIELELEVCCWLLLLLVFCCWHFAWSWSHYNWSAVRRRKWSASPPGHTCVIQPSYWSIFQLPTLSLVNALTSCFLPYDWLMAIGQILAPGLASTRQKELLSIEAAKISRILFVFWRQNDTASVIPSHYLGFNYQRARGAGVTMSLIVWLFWQFRAYY